MSYSVNGIAYRVLCRDDDHRINIERYENTQWSMWMNDAGQSRSLSSDCYTTGICWVLTNMVMERRTLFALDLKRFRLHFFGFASNDILLHYTQLTIRLERAFSLMLVQVAAAVDIARQCFFFCRTSDKGIAKSKNLLRNFYFIARYVRIWIFLWPKKTK